VKHLAIIQTEFLKLARPWSEMSLDQQFEYLLQHPKSQRRPVYVPKNEDEEQAATIARTLGVHYGGPLMPGTDLHTFSDPETRTTFVAKDLETAMKKLELKRQQWSESGKLVTASRRIMKLAVSLASLRQGYCFSS
jgi:hypothetical protein